MLHWSWQWRLELPFVAPRLIGIIVSYLVHSIGLNAEGALTTRAIANGTIQYGHKLRDDTIDLIEARQDGDDV